MAKKKSRSKTTKKKKTSASSVRRKSAGGSSSETAWSLHIVSDATGNLAGHMVRPILTQFDGVRFEQTLHAFQDTPQKVKATLKKIRGGHTVVLHALIDPMAKHAVREVCEAKQVPHYDLTGPLAQFLADQVGVPPANELSSLHQADAEYFARIDAMEYTATHDDSAGLDTLAEADIVIVGPSRVGKTPTSTFLASQGYKVANVSISVLTGFPPQLSAVRKKVVAFTLRPRELQRIREARLPEVESTPYHNMRDVIQEVMFVEEEYRKRRYPVIDTTGQTIEHNAAKVIELISKKRK